MLRMRLLGGLTLELDGRAISPPAGRPARALLAWLALHPGMHSRSRVAGRLWPDVLEESARNSLRSALGALRRDLGPGAADAFVATRDQLGLAPPPTVWVDVVAIDQLQSAGRLQEALATAVAPGTSPAAAELLPELDADWVHAAREEHHARLASLLTRLADAAERAEDLQLAIRYTRELVALDPLSDEAGRALMRRLVAIGDRPAALAAYERLRDRLHTELHVVPSRETRDLAERLRHGEGLLAGEPLVPLPPALARAQRSPFVGRAADLGLLRRSWERALAGQRQLVLVSGEAGIGKTRLTIELARALEPARCTVLLGRAYEEPLLAYQPFVEALRPLLRERGAGAGPLARLLPTAGAVRDDTLDATSDPEGARFQLFEAASSTLAAASQASPVLVVLEDLQWADRPTLLLLAHVLRSPDPARLLLVGTYRSTEVTRAHPLAELLAELRRERLGERIALRGLTADAVAALAEAWMGTEASPEIATTVHRETDGNPFFVEEMLRHLMESGPTSGLTSETLARIGVPEGVKEVIGRRLARLGEDATRVLTQAAVIGREFEFDLLQDLFDDLEDDRLVAALDEAAAAGIVRHEPESLSRYGFTHALMRETVYEELGKVRRAHLHRRVADVLTRRDADKPERWGELAHHLLQAAEPEQLDRAVEYAVIAAEQALGQLAYEETAAHIERALQALERSNEPSDERRCELLLALGDARMRAAQDRDGRAAFTAAAALARDLGRPDLLGRAALGFGGIGIAIDAPDAGVVDLLEEALRALDPQDSELRARLLARLAVELYYRDRERTDALSEEAVALARRRSGDGAIAEVLSSRHVALWTPDHQEERLRIADEMVEQARRAGDAVAELKGRNWRIVDLFELGDIPAVERELDAYAFLAEQVGLPVYRWYEPMWRATLAMLEGRLDDAERLSSEALALGRRARDPNAEALLRPQHTFYLPLERGRCGDVDLDYLGRAILRRPVGHAHLIGLVRILAELGRIEEARHELDRLDPGGLGALPKDLHWLAVFAELAVVFDLLADRRRAAAAYDLLLPYAGRSIINARAIYCYGSADYYLGLLAAICSRWSAAAEHFEAATALHRRLGARPHLCRALCGHAEALAAQGGNTASVVALASEAFDTATAVRIDRLIDKAQRIRAAATDPAAASAATESRSGRTWSRSTDDADHPPSSSASQSN